MEYGDKRRVAVRGIIYKDGKLFCQQLKDKTGKPRDFWCTPGGGLNAKETLATAVERELMEETGIQAKVGRLLFVQSFSEGKVGSRGDHEQLEFFFHIENPADFEKINESASHFDAEIANYGFVDPNSTHVLPAFLRTLDLADYITTNKPVYIYNEFV